MTEVRAPLDVHVARERAKVTPAFRRAVWAKTDGRCYLCGGDLRTPPTLAGRLWRRARGLDGPWHVAHDVALSRGGYTTLANCYPAHGRCNLRARTLTRAQYRRRHWLRLWRAGWRLRGLAAAGAGWVAVPQARPVLRDMTAMLWEAIR